LQLREVVVNPALPPLFELVTPTPYTALQHMFDDSVPWGTAAYADSLSLNELSNEAIDVLTEHISSKNSPMSFLPIFPLGGAYSDIDDNATALGCSRRARFSFRHDGGRAEPRAARSRPGMGAWLVGQACPAR
jgi:hypothetical protein